MAASQLQKLLEIISVAGIFISLPLYGLLFAVLKLREYLRDILAELRKSAAQV